MADQRKQAQAASHHHLSADACLDVTNGQLVLQAHIGCTCVTQQLWFTLTSVLQDGLL